MWLLKEIFYHRKRHYLSIMAASMSIFLLLTVNILSDTAVYYITSRMNDMGLNVTMLEIINNDYVPDNWDSVFARKFDIKYISEFCSREYGKLQIVNCDSCLNRLFGFSFEQGGFFDCCDDLLNAEKAVLGYNSYLEFGKPQAGSMIEIEGVRFEVAGIMKKYSENMFIDIDNSVFIPSGYLLCDNVRGKTFYFSSTDHYIDRYIEETAGRDNYLLFNQAGLSESVADITAVTKRILMIIADISLVAAFAGLINSSLSNVEKRSYEIGIKKSLGASDHDIFLQFLAEALAVLLVSALLAVAAVAVVILLMGNIRINVRYDECLFLIVRVMIAGMLCSLYPAIKAGRTTVMESIRMQR